MFKKTHLPFYVNFLFIVSQWSGGHITLSPSTFSLATLLVISILFPNSEAQ